MQNDTPINDNTISTEDVLGDNMKLLILHKAFNEITSKDNKKEEKEERE